jgi:hypothetical protein
LKARALIRGAGLAALALLGAAGCNSGGNTITQARCPCTLELASGDGQQAAPGAQLPEEVVVRLVDRDGTGILGGLILWQVMSGGGEILPDCIPSTCPNGGTDPSGFNRATWTLGGTGGTQTVQASSLQSAAVVTFTAQAGSE